MADNAADMLHKDGIDKGMTVLKELGYHLRTLVRPSRDYNFQTQLLARALGYPEQRGQVCMSEP